MKFLEFIDALIDIGHFCCVFQEFVYSAVWCFFFFAASTACVVHGSSYLYQQALIAAGVSIRRHAGRAEDGGVRGNPAPRATGKGRWGRGIGRRDRERG